MATSNSPESDPMNDIISVTTTEVDPGSGGLASASATPDTSTDGLTSNNAGPGPALEAGSQGPADEVVIWEDRYSLGNFFGRAIIGGLFAAVTFYFVYWAYFYDKPSIRPLVILSGIATTIYWLWLAFRIFRARLGHYYRLTSLRLFVTSGIFQSRQDMMELAHLKEVSIQQSHFLSHLFKIATVAVASNVNGAPTLHLVGIKDAQKIVDLIYLHARK